VFLCVIIYRLFLLKFWWHKSWISASRQVNSALFFNSCYFHNVGFSTPVCPRCAPRNWGGYNANLGARYKKISAVCAPNFKTVSASMVSAIAAWNESTWTSMAILKNGDVKQAAHMTFYRCFGRGPLYTSVSSIVGPLQSTRVQCACRGVPVISALCAKQGF